MSTFSHINTDHPAVPPIFPTPDPIPDPDSDTNTLSDAQIAALEMLLAGASDTAVAAALNLNRRTIYRWRTQDSFFQEELLRHRQELLDTSLDRFRINIDKAMDALAHQLQDPSPQVVFRAAKALLSLSPIGKALFARRPDPQPPSPYSPETQAILDDLDATAAQTARVLAQSHAALAEKSLSAQPNVPNVPKCPTPSPTRSTGVSPVTSSKPRNPALVQAINQVLLPMTQ